VTSTEPRVAETPPEVKAVTPPPRKRKTVMRPSPKDKGQDRRTRESLASTAQTASSGIGRGRSDESTNYVGLVRAKLVRHKHYPPDAKRKGEEGRAWVSFTIRPDGNVSRVALLRGSGVPSLDSEAQASVRRAAPFPPPPLGRSVSYRIWINFDINSR
jgi:protein TonB